MSTALQSPSINIAGIAAGSLMLAFDSCWRPEGTAQAAEITVDYGSGPLVVLRWDSDPASPNQHGIDARGAFNLNESVLIPLNNPAGATAATISFQVPQRQQQLVLGGRQHRGSSHSGADVCPDDCIGICQHELYWVYAVGRKPPVAYRRMLIGSYVSTGQGPANEASWRGLAALKGKGTGTGL